MKVIILHTQTKDQVAALKALAKAWNIKLETSTYDPDFVASVKKADKRGNYKTIDPTDTPRDV